MTTKRTPAKTRPKRRVKQHGTEGEYRRGCHCDKCKHAASEARIARRQRTTIANERDTLNAELDQLKRLTPERGTTATLSLTEWAAYLTAKQALQDAELDVLRHEVAIKRLMGTAERLRVGSRTVATWRTIRVGAYSRPATTVRRFVLAGTSRFKPYRRRPSK